MAGTYYSFLAYNDESDSESTDNWLLRPRVTPVMPEASTLSRQRHVRRGRRDEARLRSRSAPGPPDPLRLTIPTRDRDGQSPRPIHRSSSKRRTFESQIPGDHLAPPPRNPARLSATLVHHKAPPTSLAPPSEHGDGRHHHRRRSSHVEGHTVSNLAANVINTTNSVFSAMVRHANHSNNNHDDGVISGDHDHHTHHFHPHFHRHARRPSSSNSSSSDSPAAPLSHRR